MFGEAISWQAEQKVWVPEQFRQGEVQFRHLLLTITCPGGQVLVQKFPSRPRVPLQEVQFVAVPSQVAQFRSHCEATPLLS